MFLVISKSNEEATYFVKVEWTTRLFFCFSYNSYHETFSVTARQIIAESPFSALYFENV